MGGSIATSLSVIDNGTFNISTITTSTAITTLSGAGTLALGDKALSLTAAAGAFTGTITGSNLSSLTLSAGTEILNHANTGFAGAVNLTAGTLELGNIQGAGTGAITFAAGVQTLQVDANGNLANILTSFGREDIIDLRGLTFAAGTTASYNAGTHTLAVTSGGTTDTLHFDAGFALPNGYQFSLAADGAGGTAVSLTLAPVIQPQPPAATTTTNGTGGNNIVTSDPSTVTAAVSTNGFDTVYYSGSQPLTLPSNIEAVVLSGQGGNAAITGNGGNNAFVVQSGSWHINGGGGSDVLVFATELSGHTIQLIDANNYTITGVEGTQMVSNVGGVGFAHDQITFDFSGQGARVVRLYDATLHRAADIGGGTNALAQLNGGVTLAQLSQAFLNSSEGQLQYAPTQTNTQFVDALYANVLHRAQDAGGEANWVAALNAGTSRGAVLAAFSEASEHAEYVQFQQVVGIAVDHPIIG